MLTFQDWLWEDFRSDHGIIFSIDVIDTNTRSKQQSTQLAFYEKVNGNKINLHSYLMTFCNKAAANALQSPFPQLTRGLFYFMGSYFIVYIWKNSLAHVDMAKALDKVKAARKFPDADYSALYAVTFRAGKRTKIGNEWCLPVVMLNGKLITNTTPAALEALFTQKDVTSIFTLTTAQAKELIASAHE